MRSLARIVFVFIGICIAEFTMNSTVFAGPLSFSGPLTYSVNATIEPTAHIIVDPSLNIIKILSNSTSPSKIDVNLGSLSGPAVTLNSQILNEYNNLTNFGRSCHAGIIYDKSIAVNNASPSKPKMSIASLFPLNSFFKLNITSRLLLYS